MQIVISTKDRQFAGNLSHQHHRAPVINDLTRIRRPLYHPNIPASLGLPAIDLTIPTLPQL